jgi:plastocyanin
MEARTMDHRIIMLGDKGKVVPAAVIVEVGDTVTFEAQNTDAVVTFYDVQKPFRKPSLTVPANSVSAPEAVTGAPGVYPYSVWCAGAPGRSASGDSDPIIIIKR